MSGARSEALEGWEKRMQRAGTSKERTMILRRMRIPSAASCAARALVFVLGAASSGTAGTPAREAIVVDVATLGARGDGKTKDTEAIQRAIEAAAGRGGGTVYLGPGAYLSGTLFLESHVTLLIDAGARLVGSTDPADFPRRRPEFRSYTETYVEQSLIHAEGKRDVGISGRGTIDGQGAAFAGKPYRQRPYLLRFISCEDVRVEDVTLRDSPMWVQHYLDCDRVTIRGISVESHANANNDMLDVDCCRDVRISDCLGDSGDDAITLKSTGSRPCRNVVITNCAVFSTCNAIKLGTESSGGFEDIAISNCVLGPLRAEERGAAGAKMLAGIALEIVDGGKLDRIAISNITMTAVRVPIFLRLGNRARPIHEGAQRPGVGTFQNVAISNVVAEAVERIGCSVTGLPGHPIRNVSLRDIRMVLPGGGTTEEVPREVPERPEAYPECTMFGVLPAYGIYCRHVDGLSIDGLRVECKEPDQRPALVCDDVRRLEVVGLVPRGSVAGPPTVVLRSVGGALLRGCIAPEGATVFLRILGDSSGIAALANDLSRASTASEVGESPGGVARVEGEAVKEGAVAEGAGGAPPGGRGTILYQAANRLR